MLSEELIKKYMSLKPRLIVLFGSRARGDYTNESDLDVLVVADKIPKDPREAYQLLFDNEYPLVSPIGMNTNTFIKKLREGSTFLLEILEDGKIVYSDKEFLQKVIDIFNDVRKNYIRKGKTWVKVA